MNNKVKKRVVYGTEVPIYSQPTIIKHNGHNCKVTNCVACIKEREKANCLKRRTFPITSKSGKNCTKSELNSSLRLVQSIPEHNGKTPGDLTPNSKAVLYQHLNKQLNIPHGTNVFKNLVPINVNDSVICFHDKVPIRKEYVNPVERDPEPTDFFNKKDFWDPIPPLSRDTLYSADVKEALAVKPEQYRNPKRCWNTSTMLSRLYEATHSPYNC